MLDIHKQLLYSSKGTMSPGSRQENLCGHRLGILTLSHREILTLELVSNIPKTTKMAPQNQKVRHNVYSERGMKIQKWGLDTWFSIDYSFRGPKFSAQHPPVAPAPRKLMPLASGFLHACAHTLPSTQILK